MRHYETVTCPVCHEEDRAEAEFEILPPEPSVGIMGVGVNLIKVVCKDWTTGEPVDITSVLLESDIRALEDNVDVQGMMEAASYPEYDPEREFDD